MEDERCIINSANDVKITERKEKIALDFQKKTFMTLHLNKIPSRLNIILAQNLIHHEMKEKASHTFALIFLFKTNIASSYNRGKRGQFSNDVMFEED